MAVHDAARPCVSDDLLERLFEAARMFDAVIPGVPVADTLKRVGDEVEAAASQALASRSLVPTGTSALYDGFSEGGVLAGIKNRPVG